MNPSSCNSQELELSDSNIALWLLFAAVIVIEVTDGVVGPISNE